MKTKLFCIGLVLISQWVCASVGGTTDEGSLEVGAQLDEKGIFIPHSEGLVNLRIVDNKFQLYFVDAEKKLVEPDAVKIIVRYSSQVRRGESESTVVLNPGPGSLYFTASRPILPPHFYRVKVILVFADKEATEYLPEKLLNQLGTSD